jgi:NAD(P)-dependent dehydrogenase (short-subunit alcohol dehydrogenase family)
MQDKSTILITGCSSGFGLEIARYFLERDWKVVATMRTPREDVLPSSERLTILPLDVTDAESIRQAIDSAGPIDALVNNAGIGTVFPFEIGSMATVREVFETNTFGTMAVTQAVLPQFRERRSGVVVNVSSSVTLKTIPLTAAYTASKAAVNAFSECLALELQPFGIRVRVVLPGRAPETPFAQNGQNRMQGLEHEAYAESVKEIFAMLNSSGPVTRSQDVAEAVWRAVNDPSCPTPMPAGMDAVEWAQSK